MDWLLSDWMVEGTPKHPYQNKAADLLTVERNMRKRRALTAALEELLTREEAQRTEQLLCEYQATAHMLQYVLEPAGEGGGVVQGRAGEPGGRRPLKKKRHKSH